MIRDATEEIPAMSKRKRISSRSPGAEETPDAFTTPILPPSETSSHVHEVFAATCAETANVAPADTVPFPGLTTPSTPKGNFSSVPLCVQLQLQLQLLSFGEEDDGSAAADAAADTPILQGAALLVKLKPCGSPDNHPNKRHEVTNISFKSIDSIFEDDSTLTPIMENGWIIDFPKKKTNFRPVRRSGSSYLQPRKAKLFDEIRDGKTYYSRDAGNNRTSYSYLRAHGELFSRSCYINIPRSSSEQTEPCSALDRTPRQEHYLHIIIYLKHKGPD